MVIDTVKRWFDITQYYDKHEINIVELVGNL